MLVAEQLYAQFNETIRTARPGQSIGAFTVGQGIFQIQSGLDYFTSSGNGVSGSGQLSNTVMRFGLTTTFEISGLIEYKTEEVNGTDFKGVSDPIEDFSEVHCVELTCFLVFADGTSHFRPCIHNFGMNLIAFPGHQSLGVQPVELGGLDIPAVPVPKRQRYRNAKLNLIAEGTTLLIVTGIEQDAGDGQLFLKLEIG